jgi:hypothetical protein
MNITPIITSYEQKENQEDGVVLTLDTQTKTLVPKDQWNTLSFNELIEQKNILYDKWDFLSRGENKQLVLEFAQFLIDIEQIIQTKL